MIVWELRLDYFMELEVEESDKIEFLENGEPFSIPIEENLIFEAIKYTEKHLVKNIPSYKVNIVKMIFQFHVGWEAVHQLLLLEFWLQINLLGMCWILTKWQKLAVEMEGHPDNVVPAIFGGMVLTAHDKENIVHSSLINSDDLCFYVMIPDF